MQVGQASSTSGCAKARTQSPGEMRRPAIHCNRADPLRLQRRADTGSHPAVVFDHTAEIPAEPILVELFAGPSVPQTAPIRH